MQEVLKLRNPIRTYEWGSRRAIASLLGAPVPSPNPQAELWMGDHPRAPSEVWWQGEWRSLRDLMAQHRAEILGDSDAGAGGLPFLFKVLAAEQPLSLQAHPDGARARAGYLDEQARGIALESALRNYKDPNPKPEILYPLEPFWVMRGFRPVAEIRQFLRLLGIDGEPVVRALAGGSEAQAIESFFTAYMGLGAGAVSDLLSRARVRAAERRGEDEVFRWILELESHYPGDRGILAPAFLHLRRLEPGEAIYTAPGTLHAYLGGLGIELMLNSDNVLRGGLTPKQVDVPELLSILCFEPNAIEPLVADSGTPEGETRFSCPEFTLRVLEPKPGRPWRGARSGSVEVLLCTEGEARLCRPSGGAGQTLSRGESVLVPVRFGEYWLEGDARLFQASAPPR